MLLAIDTSTQLLSIALHDGEALLAECTLTAGRQHSALLAPLIKQAMEQTAVRATDLRALAVSVGPGSYTGLRIGVALAKGMAGVEGLPLVPVTTLECVAAAQSCRCPNKPLIATIPAGRKRAIWAEYLYNGESWEERRAPQINSWDELLSRINQPILLCGEISSAGLQAVRDAQDAGAAIQLASAAERLRRAGYLAEIAWRRLRENDDPSAFQAERVMPLYLKSPG